MGEIDLDALAKTLRPGQVWRGRDGVKRRIEKLQVPSVQASVDRYVDIIWRNIATRRRGAGYLALSRWWHTATLIEEPPR